MAFPEFLVEHAQAEINRQLETFDGILGRLHARAEVRRGTRHAKHRGAVGAGGRAAGGRGVAKISD